MLSIEIETVRSSSMRAYVGSVILIAQNSSF